MSDKRTDEGLTREPNEHLAASSETNRGYLTGPGLHEFPVEYVVVKGRAIHEGCIDLGAAEEVAAETARIERARLDRQTTEAAGSDDAASNDSNESKGVGLPASSSFLWSGGRVPYTINSDVPDTGRVADAIRHVEARTAIRFVERSDESDYIEIVSNGSEGWSSSAIGMRGGRQRIRFSDRHSWPILVHEFLHALGVYHEQSRSDRDEFVEIRWSNIQDGPPPDGEVNAVGNFQKKSGAIDYFDYDYDSLMHYGPRNFAKDRSRPTIVPRNPDATIGQRSGMSYGDRQTVAKLYERFFARGFSGVWRSGTGRYGLWVNAEWQSFRSKWQQWSAEGLRLRDIHVRRSGRRTLYSGVFLPGSGRYALWANVSWSSFRSRWRQWSRQGLRLIDLHVHRSGNQNRYSGIFEEGSGGHGLWVNANWSNFRRRWRQWSNEGLRLADVHVQRYRGRNRYSGVFVPGRGGHGLWANASWPDFVARWREWSDQGLRLVDLNLHQSGNSSRYTGTFLPGRDDHYLWANVTWESFRAKWQELNERGLRLIDFEILNPEDGASADVGTLAAASMDTVAAPALEEFGGVFDAQEAPTTSSAEDGGGGVLTDDQTAPLEEVDDQGGQDGGGAAYFQSEDTDVDDRFAGDGDAVFDTTDSEGTEDTDGQGGAVF